MLVFMLSLAGIPPLAGFFGKFYVFVATVAAEPGLLWLVILAVAMSAVSLYYYLQVLKRIYIADPVEGAPAVRASVLSQVVLCLIALGVVLLGCSPECAARVAGAGGSGFGLFPRHPPPPLPGGKVFVLLGLRGVDNLQIRPSKGVVAKMARINELVLDGGPALLLFNF